MLSAISSLSSLSQIATTAASQLAAQPIPLAVATILAVGTIYIANKVLERHRMIKIVETELKAKNFTRTYSS